MEEGIGNELKRLVYWNIWVKLEPGPTVHIVKTLSYVINHNKKMSIQSSSAEYSSPRAVFKSIFFTAGFFGVFPVFELLKVLFCLPIIPTLLLFLFKIFCALVTSCCWSLDGDSDNVELKLIMELLEARLLGLKLYPDEFKTELMLLSNTFCKDVEGWDRSSL